MSPTISDGNFWYFVFIRSQLDPTPGILWNVNTTGPVDLTLIRDAWKRFRGRPPDIWAPLDNTLSTCAFVYHFGRLFQSHKEHGMFNLSKLTKLPYHLAKGDQSAKLALIDHQSTTLALARHPHQVEPSAEVAETFLLFRSNGLICICNVPVDMSELLPIGLIDSMQMLKS
ncbi:hypothetical protein T07_14565 [Trichinella nelsoni]|uniref:Uncharacterized protein n=1 Tax=Trichinella nelsoni TaxID=6336 RepID=A0A0V0RK38_9BILA|nr:hypothetical protein T07_14565 [Trichinella nelsoni]